MLINFNQSIVPYILSSPTWTCKLGIFLPRLTTLFLLLGTSGIWLRLLFAALRGWFFVADLSTLLKNIDVDLVSRRFFEMRHDFFVTLRLETWLSFARREQ